MRPTALILPLFAAMAFAGDDAAPATPPAPAPAPVAAPAGTAPAAAPAPASDARAQARELELKMRQIREQVLKDDPALAKLKADADDAKKHFDTALEDKLKDNADYKAAKAQFDELRAKNGKKEHKEEKKDAAK